MGDAKGQGHIIHPVLHWSSPFSFHVNQTNHSCDVSNRVFDPEKMHYIFLYFIKFPA